jgi:adenosylmethionine-8-amino-7-oxononanoate aminotransferase
MMFGVELAEGDAAQVERGARERGAIVRATGQKIVLSPPLVIEREQLDFLADVLAQELQQL